MSSAMLDWDCGDVILLTKEDRFSRRATEIAREAFGSSLRAFAGRTGDPEPDFDRLPNPRYLISFLSPWIIRKDVLDRCGEAINFHPGSVDYPGSGCYNFALYHEAAEYGAVSHVMLPKVDTGRVIEERRFPILAEDSVETLKLRTMTTMLDMFIGTIGAIVRGEQLPTSVSQWRRLPYTRREMNGLRLITCDMSEDEVRRRVRAMTYPGYPGAIRENSDGSTFEYPVPKRMPVA